MGVVEDPAVFILDVEQVIGMRCEEFEETVAVAREIFFRLVPADDFHVGKVGNVAVAAGGLEHFEFYWSCWGVWVAAEKNVRVVAGMGGVGVRGNELGKAGFCVVIPCNGVCSGYVEKLIAKTAVENAYDKWGCAKE